MRDATAAEGIKLTFGGRNGNTINSHRLMYFAKEKGFSQTALLEQM